MNRARADWPTRIVLAVGTVSTAAVVVLLANGGMQEPCFSCVNPAVLGLPSDVVAAVGLGLAVVGLVWMLRIFRGPRDEPPVWRYRDR